MSKFNLKSLFTLESMDQSIGRGARTVVATSLIAAAWIGVALLGTHGVPGDGVMGDKAVSPPPRKETSEIKHPGIADTLSALSKPEFTRTRPGGENAPPDLQAETSPIDGKSAEADVSRVEADSE